MSGLKLRDLGSFQDLIFPRKMLASTACELEFAFHVRQLVDDHDSIKTAGSSRIGAGRAQQGLRNWRVPTAEVSRTARMFLALSAVPVAM